MRKRLFLILLVFAMMIGLVACENKGDQTTDTGTDTQNNSGIPPADVVLFGGEDD